MPKFSVVIPCYNSERFISSAIRSCLEQSVSDLEVIVIDDGSTDGSKAEIEAIAASESRVVFHRQQNRGLGAARNVGLRMARGEYLNFLDADDELESRKLQKQGQVLDENAATGLVLCDGSIINDEGAVTVSGFLRMRRFQGPADLFTVLFSGGQFPPLVPLMRRTLALEVGGMNEDRRLAGCADADFWMRVALRCPAYQIIEEPLCRYRVHPGGMSQRKREMEEAAECVYASTMSSFPAECARALRSNQRRLADLEHSVLHLRRKLDEQITLRMAADARLRDHVGADLNELLLRVIATTGHKRWGRVLLIWGAGSGGQRVARLLLQRGGRVAAFIDSDPKKTGVEVQGIRVVSPEGIDRDAFVIVASTHGATIAAQLTRMGFTQSVDFAVVDFLGVAALEAQERETERRQGIEP
jgi:hypothetical protein